jgi:hypothetical protein
VFDRLKHTLNRACWLQSLGHMSSLRERAKAEGFDLHVGTLDLDQAARPAWAVTIGRATSHVGRLSSSRLRSDAPGRCRLRVMPTKGEPLRAKNGRGVWAHRGTWAAEGASEPVGRGAR